MFKTLELLLHFQLKIKIHMHSYFLGMGMSNSRELMFLITCKVTKEISMPMVFKYQRLTMVAIFGLKLNATGMNLIEIN